MRRKYQFFISSTFRDLHEEREAVTWAVLKTRNMPAGMEAFPAGDDRGWRIIEKTIDESDFYILILGHTYGTIDQETGLSWTEKEYRHAIEQQIPVLPFLREQSATPGDMVERDPKKLRKLTAFHKLVSDAKHRVFWSTKEDLVGKVSQAIPLAISDAEDEGVPRPGWVRGNLDNADALNELAKLSEENRTLRDEIGRLRHVDDASKRPSIRWSAGRGGNAYIASVENTGVCGILIKKCTWYCGERLLSQTVVDDFLPSIGTARSYQTVVESPEAAIAIEVLMESTPYGVIETSRFEFEAE